MTNKPPYDLLYQAASVWQNLLDCRYSFTYGFKNKLHTINLSFSPEEFPHLAGFQYLKDLSLPKYNYSKVVPMILAGKITCLQIAKSNPFITTIHADYLISGKCNHLCFIFIVQFSKSTSEESEFICCSAFAQGERNYETNQRSLTILRKSRTLISSNTTEVLFDRLSASVR